MPASCSTTWSPNQQGQRPQGLLEDSHPSFSAGGHHTSRGLAETTGYLALWSLFCPLHTPSGTAQLRKRDGERLAAVPDKHIEELEPLPVPK